MTAPSPSHPAVEVAVAVFGDVMLDRYLVGPVERISPEAPVPVLHVASSFERPGGAANVAANIRSLGAVPRLVGIVGTDEAGQQLSAVLTDCDVATEWLQCSAAIRTTTKTKLLSGHQQIARIDVEESPRAERWEWMPLARWAQRAWRVLCLQHQGQ